MFNLVLIFLEHLLPSLEDLIKKTRNEKQIGKELFLLYDNLNQIIVNGQELKFEVESAISFLKEKKESNEIDRTYISHLGYKLNKQSIYLAKFFNIGINITKGLDNLKEVSYNRLAPLYTGKFTLIKDLIYTLRGEYGIDPQLISYNFKKIIKYLDKNLNKINKDKYGNFPIDLLDQRKQVDFIKSVKLDTISETNHIGQKDFKSLLFYLKHEDLDLKFDELKAFATQLKELLIQNFMLTEVILDVNERICNEPGKWGPSELW